MPYKLLTAFESLFSGKRYLHRNSALGDYVAAHLYEDMLSIGRSAKFVRRVSPPPTHVVNSANRMRGIASRRGDGTFGELVPGEEAKQAPGFLVPRGVVATVEIGAEVKILAKAMIKQIDRVVNDLGNQVSQFQRAGGRPICVGIVGINQAAYAMGYEGDREYRTDGASNRHPIQEAAEAERRLGMAVGNVYDELLILRYIATNETPYRFAWSDSRATELDYGAILVRLAREYEQRF
jgi:hypothetical protein